MKDDIPSMFENLLRSAMPAKIESEPPGTCKGQFSVIRNGTILSPRETRDYVRRVYEQTLHRKISKKELNGYMQVLRSALTVPIDREEYVAKTSNGQEVLLSGPEVTWSPGTIFTDEIER